jgi:hypothetical protein
MAEGGGEQKASVGAPAVFISYASQDVAIRDAIARDGLTAIGGRGSHGI